MPKFINRILLFAFFSFFFIIYSYNRPVLIGPPSTSDSMFLEDITAVAKEILLEHQGGPIAIKVIPKQFWTYWNVEPIPDLLLECIGTWRKRNPDYSLVVLSRNTIAQILPFHLPFNFDEISPPYQADWIRLAILMTKGGFWVDASFIMTDNLKFIHELQQKDGSEVTCHSVYDFREFNSLWTSLLHIQHTRKLSILTLGILKSNEKLLILAGSLRQSLKPDT